MEGSEPPVLRGKEVAFTGRLASMTRQEAAVLVAACGGRFARDLSRRTDYLVVGQDGWPLEIDGRLTRKLRKARGLETDVTAVTVLSEQAFLEAAGLVDRRDQIRRLHTTGQISRLLGLKGSTIRAWVKAGLIVPARTEHRLCYFDFQQVAGAKALRELVGAGVAPAVIRRSLSELKALGIGAEGPLLQLALIERDGKLLARLQGGQLVEPTGQLVFDFAPRPAEGSVAAGATGLSSREWIERALDHEEAGRLKEADRAYAEAIQTGEIGADVLFNHGNVLYALDRKEEALARFQEALDLDPAYVEAWNNLGNALGDLGRVEEAIAAYARALTIAPAYADAHYNLAETLHQAGFLDRAARHWRAYLREDSRSAWADEARSRLRSLDRWN